MPGWFCTDRFVRGFRHGIGEGSPQRFLAAGLVLLCLAPLAARAAATSAEVARGKYLAEAGGCKSCHTGPGGPAFAGGLYVDTPFGQVASPNITPDPKNGIGGWSDDDFYRVMHDGIGKQGQYLYPVMPFPWYTRASRADDLAIKAYLDSLAPVAKPNLPNKLHFPFSVREALAAWRVVFFKPAEFTPDPHASAEVNRGAYLVNGFGHCGECHDSRPVAGQSKYDKAFQGGVIDDWYAPNLTDDVSAGIGSWSVEQLTAYLKTGIAPGKGIAVGPMAETVSNLANLSTADVRAMAQYLKSLPPKAESREKLALFQGRQPEGSQSYLSFCASCHGVDGKGIAGIIPPLQNNGAVTAQGPENVIQVVLGGLEARGNYPPMIAAGAGMTDEQVAEVANYVRQTGANAAPPTAEPGMVARLRAKTDTLMNGSPQDACKKIDDPAVAEAVARSGIAETLATLTDANSIQVAQDVVRKLRSADPHIPQAQLINAITAAYCPVLQKDTTLDANWRALKLGQFGQEVYMEARPAETRSARVATPAHGG